MVIIQVDLETCQERKDLIIWVADLNNLEAMLEAMLVCKAQIIWAAVMVTLAVDNLCMTDCKGNNNLDQQ